MFKLGGENVRQKRKCPDTMMEKSQHKNKKKNQKEILEHKNEIKK